MLTLVGANWVPVEPIDVDASQTAVEDNLIEIEESQMAFEDGQSVWGFEGTQDLQCATLLPGNCTMLHRGALS